jgi:hypothetical protein
MKTEVTHFGNRVSGHDPAKIHNYYKNNSVVPTRLENFNIVNESDAALHTYPDRKIRGEHNNMLKEGKAFPSFHEHNQWYIMDHEGKTGPDATEARHNSSILEHRLKQQNNEYNNFGRSMSNHEKTKRLNDIQATKTEISKERTKFSNTVPNIHGEADESGVIRDKDGLSDRAEQTKWSLHSTHKDNPMVVRKDRNSSSVDPFVSTLNRSAQEDVRNEFTENNVPKNIQKGLDMESEMGVTTRNPFIQPPGMNEVVGPFNIKQPIREETDREFNDRFVTRMSTHAPNTADRVVGKTSTPKLYTTHQKMEKSKTRDLKYHEHHEHVPEATLISHDDDDMNDIPMAFEDNYNPSGGNIPLATSLDESPTSSVTQGVGNILLNDGGEEKSNDLPVAQDLSEPAPPSPKPSAPPFSSLNEGPRRNEEKERELDDEDEYEDTNYSNEPDTEENHFPISDHHRKMVQDYENDALSTKRDPPPYQKGDSMYIRESGYIGKKTTEIPDSQYSGLHQQKIISQRKDKEHNHQLRTDDLFQNEGKPTYNMYNVGEPTRNDHVHDEIKKTNDFDSDPLEKKKGEERLEDRKSFDDPEPSAPIHPDDQIRTRSKTPSAPPPLFADTGMTSEDDVGPEITPSAPPPPTANTEMTPLPTNQQDQIFANTGMDPPLSTNSGSSTDLVQNEIKNNEDPEGSTGNLLTDLPGGSTNPADELPLAPTGEINLNNTVNEVNETVNNADRLVSDF